MHKKLKSMSINGSKRFQIRIKEVFLRIWTTRWPHPYLIAVIRSMVFIALSIVWIIAQFIKMRASGGWGTGRLAARLHWHNSIVIIVIVFHFWIIGQLFVSVLFWRYVTHEELFHNFESSQRHYERRILSFFSQFESKSEKTNK